MILISALMTRHTTVILGAFGCGAFKNPKHLVARSFRECLDEPLFADRFETVIFAILGDENYAPFRNEFSSTDDS